MHLYKIKKVVALFSIIGAFTALNIPTANAAAAAAADPSAGLLKQIAQNTYGMLVAINDLPKSDYSLTAFIKAWMTDDSDATKTIQGPFAKLGTLLLEQIDNQNTLQIKLNSDLLNANSDTVFSVNNNLPPVSMVVSPNNSAGLPFANDLVYSTLLGNPFYPKDPRPPQGKVPPDAAYNYIRNASAMNVYHPIPGQKWGGSAAAVTRYLNYYNTVMSIESFNAYVLSNQYVDRGQFNSLQKTLIQQATDTKTWLVQVGSETIGAVLRQILMYESQTFVLLTQLVQTQRQTVTAQAMTNSLLIVSNQLNENMMVSNAKGEAPTS